MSPGINGGNRWLLVFALAAAAAAGAMAASGARRRRGRATRHSEYREDLKAWENEGGNLAPARPAPMHP